MLELKNSRKRAEGDMQLLANRVALLKVEENVLTVRQHLNISDLQGGRRACKK